MSVDTLDLPIIDASALDTAAPPAPKRDVAIASQAAVDLSKLDLTAVALAQFGDWRQDVAAVTKKLQGVQHDLSTATKIADAKSLRQRLINAPIAEARKVSKALKSKLTSVSRSIGAEEEFVVAAYLEADKLITPQIEAREKQLAEEKAERDRIEAERVEKHEAALRTLAGYAEQSKGLPAERLAKGIAYVQAIAIDRDAWEEFADRAEETKAVTIERLQALHAAAVAAEQAAAQAEADRLERERVAEEQRVEAQRLADERAELEKLRAEIEARTAAAAAAPVASPITPDTEESGESPADVPTAVDAPRSYASSEPEAAQGLPSGDEGAAAHADDSAAYPVIGVDIGSGDRGVFIVDPANHRARDMVMIHAASAFNTKFPSHPKPSQAWWDEFRELIEAAEPGLIASLKTDGVAA